MDETLKKTAQIEIKGYIEGRLHEKLNALKENQYDKREQLIAQYQKSTWLENAAKRVEQIQLVTHAVKYSHPSAKGSSHYLEVNSSLQQHALLTTHSIGDERREDVVGNAAALDVYKFLTIDIQGKPLLTRLLNDEIEVKAALSEDTKISEQLAAAFKGITLSRGVVASHKLVKQIYFPIAEQNYHLLSPLYPTCLVQAVYDKIRNDRFGDEAKAAREARFERKMHDNGYNEYPNLVIQKFGGTKPQNISQLNSQRYGESWLLASCPPIWKSQPVKPPISLTSVFSKGLRRKSINERVKLLRKFLTKTKYNNVAIRDKRAQLVQNIIDDILQYAASVQRHKPGWSADTQCNLNIAEQYWLDPYRADSDKAFKEKRMLTNWEETVCEGFAKWLNHKLSVNGGLMVGDDEFYFWEKTFLQALI
ncbi:type I-F CRISPR-associated protein Csy1 [Zooshikella ganghwensis]|uniref:Type I-F CRISPR-associated protein Csy1 n=1 Tax=Zooshikella ganghwensis TaxID=202772 RepID=A0A4P9VK51_9GAMM|nr:type I-F CRISPR-associated protein Csy1 [Zooshikella ganghwensis]RDH43675.1 type I-F CRISPR-associated protein Csy1 [Zooshikella ganghwensis]